MAVSEVYRTAFLEVLSNEHTMRVPFDEVQAAVEQVMLRLGLEPGRATLAARLVAETDRDGVRTHGIARVPRFAEMVKVGSVIPEAKPECIATFGSLERWTGNRGPGSLAAHAAMDRAMALAREHGIGAVALCDTTHWQRGGAFGWQAAEAGVAAICWTNTLPNLPPWGATTPALGNNPLIVAIPRVSGPIVLDIAMSQFSYGSLTAYRERGAQLPVPGGWDEAGELTRDPAAIEQSKRALPIGFWKGSGLSFVLDVLGAMLAGGRTAHQIPADSLQEVGLSQVFLAVAPDALSTMQELETVAQGAIDALHSAEPIEAGKIARYPGEGTLRVREENMRLGVLVDEAQWDAVLQLYK